jgi:hypothetical protein
LTNPSAEGETKMKRRPIAIALGFVVVAALLLSLRSFRSDGPLLYIRLDDKSNQSLRTDYPGSDIDAIEIVRNGKVVGAAIAVVDAHLLDGAPGNTNTFKDPSQLLGTANYDVATRKNYVSLGGSGGYVIVKLSLPLESGDVVRVHEIGAGTGGSAEPCTVAIGRSEAGPFQLLGEGSGPFEVAVPERID